MSTASVQTVADRVRQYVVENYLYMRQDATVGDDDALLAKGIIDSMGVMELVAFLEEEFGVAVADADITEANLGSLGAIARYVVARRPGGVPVASASS
jgi:acyl carrier protein